MPKGYGWQAGGWKVASDENQQPTVVPWKSNAPTKSSNLVSINWKAEGVNPIDSTAVAWNQGQWPAANLEPTWIFQGCKMTLKCGTDDEITNDNHQSTIPDTSDDDTVMSTTTTAAPIVSIAKGWPPKQNTGKSWKSPSKTWKPPQWKKPTSAPTTPETMSPPMKMKATPKPKINWKKPTPNIWKQPPTTMMWTETTPEPTEMTWKPPPPPMKWKKVPRPTKSWKPPPTKSWKPPPTKSWKPPKMPVKTWPSPIATPKPDPTTKPDCKDTTDTTQPPQPHTEDDDLMEPPQIIIITKLPKSSPPGPKDKKDKDGTKPKPPLGPWAFPPRKYNSKYSKNRKDKKIPIGSAKWQTNRPSRNNYKQTNVNKGWKKAMHPTKYPWPSSAMRRWTTKKPVSLSPWKSKYPKSRSWREMLKKLMSGM